MKLAEALEQVHNGAQVELPGGGFWLQAAPAGPVVLRRFPSGFSCNFEATDEEAESDAWQDRADSEGPSTMSAEVAEAEAASAEATETPTE